MIRLPKLHSIPDKLYLSATTLFFLLLGSQIFVNHWFAFIFFALFLINWKKIFSSEVLVLSIFLLAIFASHIYIHIHYGVFGNEDSLIGIIVELLMLFTVYLLGVSLKGVSTNSLSDERKLFYLLYSFFIAYTLVVVYSYFAFPLENKSIGKYGMHLYYTAIESLKHIHRSNQLLAPTIVAYGLTMMVTIIPFVLFDSKAFKVRGFKLSELLFLGLVSFSALYFSILMGRRITILILLLVLFFVALKIFIKSTDTKRIRFILLLLTLLASLSLILYYFRDSISLFERIKNEGFGDSSRFLLWSQGWNTMMEYPWGGGGFKIIYAINGRTHYYGHDAWLDIGKRFGIIPSAFMVLFWLLHIRYFIRILKNEKISSYMKSIIFVITLALFANWLIEAIPLTHRSFFFYTIFFLGFLKAFSDLYSEKLPSQTQGISNNLEETTKNQKRNG